MTEYLIYWLIAANMIAFILMVVDKHRAEEGERRIREDTLLSWALFGGAFGTFAASRLVRHKTRKQPFALQMTVLFLAQAVLLGLWAFGFLDRLITTV